MTNIKSTLLKMAYIGVNILRVGVEILYIAILLCVVLFIRLSPIIMPILCALLIVLVSGWL